MPELPDLQAFAHNLSKKLTGRKVEKIHAIYQKKISPSEKGIQKAINGAKVSSINREGKELHFAFDNGAVLGIHLMLRGQLQYFERINDNKFTILEILFDNGTGLAVTDRMKQATVTLNPESKIAPDALSPDAGFEFFRGALAKSRSTIKKVLTDQEVIRGIGNAYADEILWHARISPFSVSNRVPEAAIRRLAKSIKTIFSNAEKQILKASPDIIGGEIRDFMLIHNPEKTQSPTGAKILRDENGGRKTYYTDEQELWK